jgi:tetratricopeptide (TPR) repeat protein
MNRMNRLILRRAASALLLALGLSLVTRTVRAQFSAPRSVMTANVELPEAEPLLGAEIVLKRSSAASVLLNDADLLYQQQRFEEVVRLLAPVVAQGFEHLAIWLRLAHALHRLQRWDEALQLYRRAAQQPLPESSELGFIEAGHTRAKTLLNIASVHLAMAQFTMNEFRRHGIPGAQQNRLMHELSTLRESVQNARNEFSPALATAVSSAPPADSAVAVEYLTGAPAARVSSRRRE